MNLKQTLMYPFGNPMDDISETDQIALRNVLNLARERVWMATGRPIPEKNDMGEPVFTDELAGYDLDHAQTSIQVVERVLRYIDTQKNGQDQENTQEA